MLGWQRKSKLSPYERGFVCPGRNSPSPPPPLATGPLSRLGVASLWVLEGN